MTTSTISESPLDNPPERFLGQPLFAETVELLRCVRDHDFDTLAGLCDDDFGIIDIDPNGGSVPIRTRAEWEAWFRNLFATLDAMGASTDSRIDAYDVLVTDQLGYSVLEFRQTLTVSGLTAAFDCIATIIWKHTEGGWKESRWHCSVIDSEVPDELRALAEA